MFLALISPSFCVIGPIIDLNWAEFKALESDSPSRVNRQKIGTEQESEIGTKFFFRPEMRKTDGFNFELLFLPPFEDWELRVSSFEKLPQT